LGFVFLKSFGLARQVLRESLEGEDGHTILAAALAVDVREDARREEAQ
jgi:hypothetical protein